MSSTTEPDLDIRVCIVKAWENFKGYGFNLHAQKGLPGQFIGNVDESSPAYYAGLKANDRIIEVNNVNVTGETHSQVVERIKSNLKQTILLVVQPETEKYCTANGIILDSSMEQAKIIECPATKPDLNATDITEEAKRLTTEEPEENVYDEFEGEGRPTAGDTTIETKHFEEKELEEDTSVPAADDTTIEAKPTEEKESEEASLQSNDAVEKEETESIGRISAADLKDEAESVLNNSELLKGNCYPDGLPPPDVVLPEVKAEEEAPVVTAAPAPDHEDIVYAATEDNNEYEITDPDSNEKLDPQPSNPSQPKPSIDDELDLNMSAAEMRARLGGNKRRVVMTTSGTFQSKAVLFHQL